MREHGVEGPSTAPMLSPHGPSHSLIGLRSVVGNQAMTQILLRRSGVSRPSRKGSHARGGFVIPLGASASPPVSHESNGSACVQRHSAYEHYLLGQVAPTKLAEIPMIREIPSLKAELAALKKQMEAEKVSTKETHEAGPALEAKIEAAEAKKEDVRHTIVQEMDRLLAWKDNPEAIKAPGADLGKPTKQKDETWGVPSISIPCSDGAITVAYSEINTLPDLFGNPEAMKATPKAKVLGLLQGVRQQAYIELDNLHKEIFGTSRNVLYSRWLPDADFQGARGPRAQAVNEKAYEIRMESQVNADTSRAGAESDAYFAALERNACHFFPENRIQWTGYHQKARALATQAAEARASAKELKAAGKSAEAEPLEKRAGELGNEAMLQNAFGEHYLQDAYAGGHLVNKTKIMQWFVQWLDTNGGLGTSDLGKAQFAMAKHAASQDLTSNPQALDDRIKRGELSSMSQASSSVGMSNKPETAFMMKWRRAAAANPAHATLTAEAAAADPLKLAADEPTARTQMLALVAGGFAERKTQGIIDKVEVFVLAQKIIETATAATGPYKSAEAGKKDGNIEEETAEFNLAAYNQFLSNAYIQAATKFFHDKYCKDGLDVTAANGEHVSRVYGDNNMLKAGGQAGVAYSAETSKRSRESIFETIDGHPEKATSLEDILGRFPAQASEKDGGTPMPLDDWNNSLHERGKTGLFAEARGYGAKALSMAKSSGSISGGNAIDIALLSKQLAAKVEVPKHDEGVF